MHKLITATAVIAGLAAAPATALAIGTTQSAYGCADGQSGVGLVAPFTAAANGAFCLYALKNSDSTVTINVLVPSGAMQPGAVEIASDGGVFEPKGEGYGATGFTLPAIQPGPHTWVVRTTIDGAVFTATASMTTIADDPTSTNYHDPNLPAGAVAVPNETMISAGLMPANAPTGTAMSAETAAVVASLLEVAPAIFAATPEPVAAAPVAGWCATICAA